jgi:hypothetical protein
VPTEFFDFLKATQREIHDGFQEPISLRFHRALSSNFRAERPTTITTRPLSSSLTS